jgi:hypothetical protein
MTNMAGQEELAQLEAQRDRLQAMIAYHNRSIFGKSSDARAPAWFIVVAAVVLCGIGVSLVAGVCAGQFSSDFLLLLVALPPLVYILTRRITIFGIPSLVGDIILLGGGSPAGEPDTRQRLAECEARIMKLKEGRS